jgi:hypothetical protein
MSTGLLASTVTPGNTAPLVSRTVPVILLCAKVTFGRSTKSINAKKPAHAKVAGLILDFIYFSPVSSPKSSHGPAVISLQELSAICGECCVANAGHDLLTHGHGFAIECSTMTPRVE